MNWGRKKKKKLYNGGVNSFPGGHQAGRVQQEAGSEDGSGAFQLLEFVIYFWSVKERGVWTLKVLDESNRWTEDYSSNLFPFCFLYFSLFFLFAQCVLAYFLLIPILYQQNKPILLYWTTFLFSQKHFGKLVTVVTHHLNHVKPSPIAFVTHRGCLFVFFAFFSVFLIIR